MKRESLLLAGSLLFNLALPSQAQLFRPVEERLPEPGQFPYLRIPLTLPREPTDSVTIKDCCRQLSADKRRIYLLFDNRYRMSLRLKGIYTRANNLFFRLHLANHSNLDYEADSLRFFIVEERRRGLPGLQPVRPLHPLFIYGNTNMIRGKTNQESVIVLPRFTLSQGSHLVIQVMEKNGGRHLHIMTDNSFLLRARQI